MLKCYVIKHLALQSYTSIWKASYNQNQLTSETSHEN